MPDEQALCQTNRCKPKQVEHPTKSESAMGKHNSIVAYSKLKWQAGARLPSWLASLSCENNVLLI